MAWWGKLIGGAFGFMLGGPLGAVLGAGLGHQFDKGMGSFKGDYLEVGDRERVQTAFFTATFSVMGHLAKADGRVTPSEIDAAEGIMGQMRLTPEQRSAAIRLFQAGKDPGFPLHDAIEQFRVECHHRTTLLRMFMEIQVQAAMADGHVHPAEREVLRGISDRLGLPPGYIDEVLRFVHGATGGGRGDRRGRQRPTLEEAYETLGVSEVATDTELKKAYRRLMSQHHPDKLVSKGLPEEMMKLATEKTQQIQKAYDLIKEHRQR